MTLPPDWPEGDDSGVAGEVIFVDAFGNLITNIKRDDLGSTPIGDWTVAIVGERIDGLIATYGDCPMGRLVALIGSSGRVEVAELNGSAARRLGVGRGTPVRMARDQGSRL